MLVKLVVIECFDLGHIGGRLDLERIGGERVDPDGDLLLQPEPVWDRVA